MASSIVQSSHSGKAPVLNDEGGQASISRSFLSEPPRQFEALVADRQIGPPIATQGIQLQLITPSRRALSAAAVEPKGVVYTKRWVVELLLDLSGYCQEKNLLDVLAVEPAAGDGAFLGPMIERLVESCRRLRRPLSDCQHSLIAYELVDCNN